MEAEATGAQSTPVSEQAARVKDALRPVVPHVALEPYGQYLEALVPAEQLEPAARALKEQLGYEYLSMVTAVDYPDRIEVVYLAFALAHPHGVFLKANLPREELPSCPSLTGVWSGAEFQEREVYDLMGINFVGHPDLRRILTEDDFPGHPLRKDFSIEPDYVLVRHLRYGAEGQLRGPENESPADGDQKGSP